MSNSSSFLPSASSAISAASSVKYTPTAYDLNKQEFGAVAATAIGVAATATDAVSSTYQFSEEGLKRLSDMASSAVGSVENAFSDASTGLSTLGHTISDEFKKAYGAADSAVTSVVATAEDAGSAIGDAVSSAASSVSDAAGYVKDEVSSAVDATGRYLSLGFNALL